MRVLRQLGWFLLFLMNIVQLLMFFCSEVVGFQFLGGCLLFVGMKVSDVRGLCVVFRCCIGQQFLGVICSMISCVVLVVFGCIWYLMNVIWQLLAELKVVLWKVCCYVGLVVVKVLQVVFSVGMLGNVLLCSSLLVMVLIVVGGVVLVLKFIVVVMVLVSYFWWR